jgi:hypothetical protein
LAFGIDYYYTVSRCGVPVVPKPQKQKKIAPLGAFFIYYQFAKFMLL